MKPQNWEEAFDQLADENSTLWNALNQLVSLWDMEASLSELENSIARARDVLKNTNQNETTTV